MRARFLMACLAIAAAMPLSAAAEQAFTASGVEVFAGPSSEYPPIAQLPPNTAVYVAGCLSDWSWCDIRFANDRGWVYAGDLVVPFQGSRVVIIEYGPRIHLPVVTFSLVTYWDRYYRARPFYAERQQWVNRVHVEANHGGRAPSGHERAAQQSAPSAPVQQAPQRQAQPRQAPERNAQAAEKSRRPETARTGKEAQPPKEAQPSREAQQSREAQAPKQAQSREPQRAQVAQSPQPEQPGAQERRRPQEAQQAPKPESSPKAESRPDAARPPEAPQRESGRAQQEEKAKKERQPEAGQQ